MNKENQFKDKVQGLVNEKQFGYNAANWEQVSMALDKKERKKKLLIWFILFGLFTGIGLSYIYTNRTQVPTTLLSSVPKTRPVQSKTETTLKPEQMKQARQTNTLKPLNKQKAKKEIHNKPAANALASFDKNSLFNRTENTVLTQVTLDQTNENNSHSLTQKALGKENNIIEKKVLPNHQLMNLQIKPRTNDSLLVLNKPEIGSIPNFSYSTYTKNEDGTMNLEPIHTFMIKKDSGFANLNLVAYKADSSSKFEVNKQNLKAMSKGSFILELGTYFNFGWKYNRVQEGLGINLYSGISYSRKIIPKLNLVFGACYAPVSHLKASKKIITNYTILFGERSEIAEIQPLTLNYLQVPLSIHYLLNSRHGLSLAYAFNYLIDVRSKVYTYTEELHSTFDKNSFKTFGYTDGFAKVNHTFMLGYRMRIGKELWLNNQFYFGLTELRDDDLFNNVQKEKSRGILVSLNYYLPKK